MNDYNYIGASMPRYDGEGRVTGKTIFVDDVRVPGMCYVKAYRSPIHKGIIKNIDATETLKIPGVLGILGPEDVPGINCGWFGDCEIFAEDRVRFLGQIVRAVVAETEELAWEGVQKLKVEYEEQEPVFDMFEAIKPGAPVVWGGKDNYFYWGDKPTFTLKLGDVEEGFKQADYIIESDYSEGAQDHVTMETHASVAYHDGAGRLCIHTPSQCLYFQLRPLCAILNLPMSKIRYIGGTLGGGFGAKNEIHTDHIAAIAAIKFKRPMKFRWTRKEDLCYSTKRGVWKFHYKDGFTKDGRIVARKVEHWHDAGAFCTFTPYGVEKGSIFLCGPYLVPNVLIEGHAIFTNKPISSSVRGFCVINGQYCADVQMEKAAKVLGMDPWEIRMLNAWRDGDMGASRYIIAGAGAIEATKSTAELANITLPDNLMQMSSRGR